MNTFSPTDFKFYVFEEILKYKSHLPVANGFYY